MAKSKKRRRLFVVIARGWLRFHPKAHPKKRRTKRVNLSWAKSPEFGHKTIEILIMFTKRCFLIVIALLLITVRAKSTQNANIVLDKSTVKCKDEISNGQPSEDFKWRPQALSKMEPPVPMIIRKNCFKKSLSLRLKVIDDPSAASPGKDSLLVVDEVENDLIRGKLKSRLIYPLVLKVSQLTPSILTYPIKLLYRVNAQPYEEVISLNSTKDYAGCYFGPGAVRPTCGAAFGGFCCSCNSNRGNKCTKPFSQLSEVMQSSAHCLRFSPYWYGVYSLDKPEIYHQVSLQLIKNEELRNGTIRWKGIFPGKGVTLGTQKPHLSLNSVTLQYNEEESQTPEPIKSYIDVGTSRLLVPILNPVSVSEKSNLPKETLSTLSHPSLEEGYEGEDSLLILSKSLLAPEGSECNRAGTSFPAFDQQHDPCSSPRNSCLQHQPLDLWRSRKHSVGAYGPVPKISSPLTLVPGGRDGILLMENKINDKKTYFIDIEIAKWKDSNLISRGYNPIFEFMLTDTSWKSGAKITAQIINSERMASKFKIELKNCPGGLSGESEMKWIRPLESETFVINLENVQGINETEECFVVVLNEVQETVGGRDVKFKDGDTCICSGRCKCVCVKDSMKCNNLEWEGLVAAGLAVWDEEMITAGNGSSTNRASRKYRENDIFNEMDDTVTQWWYWSIVILGIPILAVFLIGMLCWYLSKFRKKSGLNLTLSGNSFPEGDKRHFSISDEGDEVNGKNSSSESLSKSKSGFWKKKNGKKELDNQSRSNVLLPREKEAALSRTFTSSPSGGSGDTVIAHKSLETMHRRRESFPIAASSSHPLMANPATTMQNSSFEPGHSNRMMNSTPRIADSKTSVIGSDTGVQKSGSSMLSAGKFDSTVFKTGVHQTESSASESGKGLGGHDFGVELDERKGLKISNHRRYGSWHRPSAAASKSILELCELTSSSECVTINGRPNPHHNYD